MRIKTNALIESCSGRLLVIQKDNGFFLPNSIAKDEDTLQGGIIKEILVCGVNDIPESDLKLYRFENCLQNDELVIHATFLATTRRTRIGGEWANKYVFKTMLDLKKDIELFKREEDETAVRRWIIKSDLLGVHQGEN